MIKAVIFDYGGVVKIGHPLSNGLKEVFGVSEEEIERTRAKRKPLSAQTSKGLLGEEQYLQKYFEFLGRPMPINCLGKLKENYRQTFSFSKEALAFAEELRKKKIITAVLSNIFKFEADVIREKHGYDKFNPVVLSCEVGMMKPDLEIYSFIVSKLGLKAQECIFIDDREENLPPAQSIGIRTVLFKNIEQAKKEVLDIIDQSKLKNLESGV